MLDKSLTIILTSEIVVTEQMGIFKRHFQLFLTGKGTFCHVIKYTITIHIVMPWFLHAYFVEVTKLCIFLLEEP